jgi:hypothetical protein
MHHHDRTLKRHRLGAQPLFLTLALAALAGLAPATRAADGTPAASEERTRKPGALGLIFASAPRAVKPWHALGDFYAGVGLGPTFFSDHTKANDDGSLSGVNARDTGFGWQISAGFAGHYVGAEVGWLDPGSSKFDAVSDGSGYSWGAGDVSAKVEGGGWTASALARIPIKPRWVMLARVGVLGWSARETFTENFGGGGTSTSYDEDSGTTVLYGVGFEYDIYSRDHFWLRTEMTRAQVDNDELPVIGVTGSLVFHYWAPSKRRAPRGLPSAARRVSVRLRSPRALRSRAVRRAWVPRGTARARGRWR